MSELQSLFYTELITWISSQYAFASKGKKLICTQRQTQTQTQVQMKLQSTCPYNPLSNNDKIRSTFVRRQLFNIHIN